MLSLRAVPVIQVDIPKKPSLYTLSNGFDVLSLHSGYLLLIETIEICSLFVFIPNHPKVSGINFVKYFTLNK